MSNTEVRCRVLGEDGRPSGCTKFFGVGIGWHEAKNNQIETLDQFMKFVSINLKPVGRCKVNYHGQWLQMLGNTTQNQSQKRRFIHSLFYLIS